MASYQEYTLSTWLRLLILTDHLNEAIFVRFLHSNLFPCFLYCTFVGEVTTMHSPRLRSRKLCSTLLRAEYLDKLFGILLNGKFVSLLSFMYLFTLFSYQLEQVFKINPVNSSLTLLIILKSQL